MLKVVSKGKSKKAETVQVVLQNGGKSVTKHLMKDRKTGKYTDKKGLVFNI